MSNNPKTLGERYRQISKMGAGATSVVYRAEDAMLNRAVAIKMPKEGLLKEKPHYRKIFFKEAQQLALLEHPGIVPLYEYGESDNGPVLVMRHLHTDLAHSLRRQPDAVQLSLGTVASDLAAALDHCAASGIAHRDLKADNVLMDAYGHAYLTDFGLATRFDDIEKWEEALGTAPFVSPEQLLRKGVLGGQQLRARSDQFSFGVLLYQILTDSLPFNEPPAGKYPSGWEFCTAWRLMSHESFVSCHARHPNIPQRLDDVLARMMSIDPNDRYPSSLAAADDLRETLAGRGSSGVQVFVSFSHTDENFAAKLIEQIESSGFRVWWDKKIEKGQVCADQIEEAMLSSDGMLVLMSPASIQSQESKHEWNYWLDHIKRPLIPVMIADCRPPYRLAALQQISAKGRSFPDLSLEIVQWVRNAMARSQRIKPSVLPPKTAAYLKIPSSFVLSIHSADLLKQDKLASLKTYLPNAYRLVLAPALEQFSQKR